jgi:aminopeptidase N
MLISLQATAQKVDVYNRPVQVERSREMDVLHYRVNLKVDPVRKSLSGVNEITLVPLNDGFNRCTLDAEYLKVLAVKDQNGTSLDFDQDDQQVRVRFPKNFTHRDTLRLKIGYELTKANLGLRFIDSTATNPRLVSSDCFPNKARMWIPCYDYPNDKATNEMIVTVAHPYKVLSNGKLVSITDNRGDGTWTWHWSQELPHSTYLINLSIGDYLVIKDSLGSLPINYWVYQWQESDARSAFRKTPHMISFFNDLYRFEYPWAKYDQVITPYMGGGAEATTATLLGEGVVMDKNAEQDYSWERVIAHEIAHQWWGDIITLRSWEHTWLNESFATYSDYLYTNNEYGTDEGAWDLRGKRNQYLNEARNRYVRPIVFDRYENPNDNFDSHTYPKGANVLHLLRYMLGDDTFFRVLSTFLHQNAFKPVDTHDLLKVVKEVSGKNMDWFFDQFIFKPGHLVVEVTKQWDSSRKTLIINVLQKQDSLPGVPVYRIPVNFGFAFADRKEVKEVWLSRKSETFEFPFESEPLNVRFDEGNWILKECRFQKSLNEWLYQAENDEVIGRHEAVEQLKAWSNEPRVRQVWERRAKEDPFWSVRQAALVTLAADPSNLPSELLLLKTHDESSKVRLSAVRILADTRDRSLIRMFKKIVEADNSYAVRAEALKAIGKCGGNREQAYLKKFETTPSYRNVISKAAQEALKSK